MFSISYNLNKKAQGVVIFADENLSFLNQLNYFSIFNLKQINLFKSDLKKSELIKFDLIENNKKTKVILYKLKKNPSEYDYQKAGGLIFQEIKNCISVNILIETLPNIKKNISSFCENFLLGLLSRSYIFKNYKIKKNDDVKSLQSISLVSTASTEIQNIAEYALNIYKGIEETRNLVTQPANILNPKNFVKQILLLKKIGISVEVLNEKKMKSLGMNALLGVGQGSANESYLVVMKWKGSKSSKEKPLAFVGKGVCFDTGGISLKPAAHMEDMKYDMGGAGTVTGLMKTLALRKAKVNVIGVVGLVENMADGNAQRPGDVVKSYSGQSIEVLNTDAEGRLVLADAIAYTEDKFNPKFIINLATLTGAIVVSLGNEYAGLFSNNDNLAKQIYETGLKDNEKAWRFPLHENYDRLMDSKIADLQNINYSGGGGSITAAQFLQRFIRKGTPWAHLDIAGMAWTKKDTEVVPEGATGYGVKLLNRLIKEHYEK